MKMSVISFMCDSVLENKLTTSGHGKLTCRAVTDGFKKVLNRVVKVNLKRDRD